MPPYPTTRKRKVPYPGQTGSKFTETYTNLNDPSINYTKVTRNSLDLSGTQVTVSEGHPFHSSRGKQMGDVGGEFFTQRSYVEGGPARRRIFWTGYTPGASVWRTYTYEGPVWPTHPYTAGKMEFPPAASSTNSALDALGATAISRCAPGNPPANALTFLGELYKDGLPHLIGSQTWKDRTLSLKNLGNEYLNKEFGWDPLVSDIKSLSNSVIHADSVLDQFERDAGKQVRRHFQFPTKRTVEKIVSLPNQTAVTLSSAGGFYDGSSGTLSGERVTTRRQWFSGAFTYYLPSDYESRNAMRSVAARAKHLLGFSLTPDVVWELTPWSWAADWFSNAGDVIHNVGRFANGGLVMRYGYMMEHTIVKDTYSLDKTGLTGIRPVPPLVLVTETKIRRKANPYGFGLTWEGLSSFQASILGALGLTKFGK